MADLEMLITHLSYARISIFFEKCESPTKEKYLDEDMRKTVMVIRSQHIADMHLKVLQVPCNGTVT